jgi:hypothetical protein
MRSLLIEFHRPGNNDTGLLREGDRYIVAAAAHPVHEFVMTIDDKSFRSEMQSLRYKGNSDDRTKALKELGGLVTEMLRTRELTDVKAGEFPLQLDLVVNAAELAALPFEAATDSDDRPLLAQSEHPIVLTRRVRHDFAEIRVTWPAKPRILFAWACPPGAGVDVPYEDHARALRTALEPWIPDLGTSATASASSGVLTVLENASLGSIRKACDHAIAQKKPFSHVHLLAHGCAIGRRGFDQRFGIALHDPASGELQAASPEELTEALAPLRGQPVILTLATCDAANETNAIIPEKSIAHALHVSGIPVVVASQLPLTVKGSTLVVQYFYGALLQGKDARLALHEARCALLKSVESGHDYVSLVGYVQLPEGYQEQLSEVRLQSVLTSLRALRSCADELLNGATYDPTLFDRLTNLLHGRVELLERCLPETEKTARRGVLEEHLGLLGSSEKRLAELYFERCVRSGLFDWKQNMRDSLERARSWYKSGFDCNLSHHWDGVQFLSLEAVLTGSISEPGLWQAAAIAAEIDRKKPNEYWAQGSLAELYLLAAAAGLPDGLSQAVALLDEMKTRVTSNGDGDRFPLESTASQFRRYVNWWTNENGFFPGRADFAAQASRLVDVLCKEHLIYDLGTS